MRLVAGVLAVALLAPAGASGAEPGNSSDPLHTRFPDPLPPFALTERSGRTITPEDLRGKVWVVSFFFTSCNLCPQTTTNMKRLQKELSSYPDVRLVSISVDPQHDTPEVLRKYATDWGADPERWLFLTGDEQAVYTVVKKAFFQGVEKNGPEAGSANAVTHTFRLMIVDRQGYLRGYIDDGKDPAQVTRLAERVKQLVQPPFWPALNATLNGCCGVLLVLGYLAIRGRWVAMHKALMLSALAVSIAFLTCYLYYHLVVQHGQPTQFGGEGPARSVYLAILLSHTVLAVVVAPLALVTTYLGLRDRLARHVRLARWTLPLWLYVSVTGVVVYWMLYHLYPPV